MNINSVATPKIILTFCGTDEAGLWMGEHSVQREVANTINIQSWEHAHSTYDVEFGPEKKKICNLCRKYSISPNYIALEKMWVWLLQEIVKSPLIRPLMHFLLKTQLKEVGVVHFYQNRSQKHVLNQLSPFILRTQLRDPL